MGYQISQSKDCRILMTGTTGRYPTTEGHSASAEGLNGCPSMPMAIGIDIYQNVLAMPILLLMAATLGYHMHTRGREMLNPQSWPARNLIMSHTPQDSHVLHRLLHALHAWLRYAMTAHRPLMRPA